MKIFMCLLMMSVQQNHATYRNYYNGLMAKLDIPQTEISRSAAQLRHPLY